MLEELSSKLLFTPVTAILREERVPETRRVRVLTLQVDGRRFVPTFSSEELFINWAQGDYQCLSVPGSDLALSLPPNTGLVIDLGQPNELRLSAADVLQLIEPCAPDEEIDAVDARLLAIEKRLLLLLQCLPAVREAYLVGIHAGAGPAQRRSRLVGAALGLFTMKLPADERFEITRLLAELSREYFGEASAIELFDDLSSESSPAWELFVRGRPFLERETSAETLALASDVEVFSFPEGREPHGFLLPENKPLLSRLFGWAQLGLRR